jgi:hypothetical protein
MLTEALRYPLESDGWVRTVLIGGLLTILSVLILPWFLLQGYYVRVLHGVTNGDPLPPAFTDWVELLVDGLKLFVLNILVTVGVFLVQALVAVVTGTGALLAENAPAAGPDAAGNAPGAAPILLFLVGIIALTYVVPAMIANFARQDSLMSAFDMPTVFAGALTREYLLAWVLSVAVGLVLGFVATLLSLLIVGIFALFYVQIVTYYLFGRGFAAGLDAGGGTATATPR